MGWITISCPQDPALERKLRAKLDEGKPEWELDLERKLGRPDAQADHSFDAARDNEGHR